MPLPVGGQCHPSNNVLVFQLIFTPFICHSVLPLVHLLSFIMCLAHFGFALVMYWSMSVTLVLCVMVMLRILYFSLIFSIGLSLARWLVSNFFTNVFARDHAWHPYVIAVKTRWLKTFLFRLVDRCLSRGFLCTFQKHPILLLFFYRNCLPCSVFHYYCLS